MRVLITGGAGMIGSCVAEYYAKKGDEVIVLDNLIRSQLLGVETGSVEHNLKRFVQYSNIQHIKGDVRSELDVKGALGGGVDVVIHTAGQPGVKLSIKLPMKDFNINALGTINVLECTRQICPKAAFVYCSSNKVYGTNVDKIPISESNTRYIYLSSKGGI